jgi:hypothetical protein
LSPGIKSGKLKNIGFLEREMGKQSRQIMEGKIREKQEK